MGYAERFGRPPLVLQHGPGPYVQECLMALEIAPGVSFGEWLDASAHASAGPQQKPTIGGYRIPCDEIGGIANAHTESIRLLTNYVLGHGPNVPQDQLVSGIRDRLAMEFASRDAMIAYGQNHGMDRLDGLARIDGNALATAVINESLAALARYQQEMQHGQGGQRYR